MKEPLLLLHGAISCRKQFNDLIPLLKEQFDVHAFDFPGHGGTAIPGTYSIPDFAAAVLGYMDEQKIQQASVFGYSMGGYAGLFLAAYHPGRIRKVFTLATKFNWTPETAAKESAMLNPEKILNKVPSFAERLEEMHAPQDWKIVLNKTVGLLHNLGQAPTLTAEVLGKIKSPVTIGIGALDKMVSVEESGWAAAQIKNAKLLLLPETEHSFEKVNLRLLAEHLCASVPLW